MLHQIGAGSLGPVFRAYEPDHDRLVAVKVFRLDLAPERAHELADALRQLVELDLKHPAIAAPLAAGVRESVVYLAQEYFAGESLEVAVRQYGPAPVSEAVRLATQLAGAIDFAAVSGIHHGVLHPRDVLVAPDEVRVTGFGIAAALERVGLRAPVRRPYCPPERMAGGAPTTAADIFSLAALTYELLSGHRFSGAGDELAGDLDRVPSVDRGALRDLFQMALATEPERRYPTARAFAAVLETALGAEKAERAASGETPKAPGRARASTRSAAIEPGLPLEPEPELESGHPPAPAVAETDRFDVGGLDLARPSDAAAEVSRDLAIADVAPPSITGRGPLVAGGDDLGGASLLHADAVTGPPIAGAPVDALGGRQEEPPVGPRVLDPLEGGGLLGGDEFRLAQAKVTVERGDPAEERPRPAMLPFALTLVVGLLVGFVVGYGFGSRERPTAPVVTSAKVTEPAAGSGQPAPPKAAGREWTEGAIPSQALPVPPEGPAGSKGKAAGDRTRPAGPAAGSAAAKNAPEPARKSGAAKAPPATATEKPTLSVAESQERGRLVIRSTPSGAKVTVDGRDRGVTPLTVDNLSWGMHAVSVARTGYATQERRIPIIAERPSALMNFGLRPAEQAPGAAAAAATFYGSLSVDTRPPAARVFLDGKLVGTTPLVVPQVQAGEHALRIERDGYQGWTSVVRIANGERSRVTASLERGSSR